MLTPECQLEQLERLRSEIAPAAPWLPTLEIHIRSQVKRRQSYKFYTRHSENDNTPQPLDQWMNSPFMGQQVGMWSICPVLWATRKPIVHPKLYPTHISFIPSQSTFPLLKYGYQKFNLENPRSSSWERSKFKVTIWVQHQFTSFYDNPPSYSYNRAFFLNLTFKIQGQRVIAQGHILGITSYRLISLSFHVDRPSHSWDAAI